MPVSLSNRFSFSSYADKRRLIEQGLLDNDADQWTLTTKGRATIRKRSVNPMVAARFNKDHAALRGNELVAEVYRKYPYYATRSEIVNKVLKDKTEREIVAKERPVKAAAGWIVDQALSGAVPAAE